VRRIDGGYQPKDGGKLGTPPNVVSSAQRIEARPLHAEWKEIKRDIGTFVCRVEGALGGASDIEVLKKATFEKGVAEGKRQEKEDYCKDCSKRAFYLLFNGEHSLIEDIMLLDYEDRSIIRSMVRRMAADSMSERMFTVCKDSQFSPVSANNLPNGSGMCRAGNAAAGGFRLVSKMREKTFATNLQATEITDVDC